MAWFYVHDHQTVGPLSPAEFEPLVVDGVITAETWVWQPGWRSWIRWRECAPPIQSAVTVEQVIERKREVRLSTIWPAAWAWFQREPGPLIGWVAAAGLLIGLISAVGLGLSLLLPLVNTVLSVLVTGPLSAGAWLMLLVRWRGGPLELRTVFRCFGPRYWPLVVGLLIQQIVTTLTMLLSAVGLAPMFYVAYRIYLDPEAVPPAIALGTLLLGAAVGMTGIVVYFYLTVAWLFAPLLMLDKGMAFWPAMELSRRVTNQHPWSFSWFLLVVSTFALAGGLLLGVGWLVTVPLAALTVVIAYDRLVGDLAETAVVKPSR